MRGQTSALRSAAGEGVDITAAAESTQHGWRVPLSDLALDEELLEAAVGTIRSGWWSMGPKVETFERTFADFCEVPHAIAVASGTAALHLALLAADCGPGDEVILPSLNFVAAANTIVHTGATPIFCDIRSSADLNLASADVEAAVTPRTKAILALHYAGYPCDMDSLTSIARRRDLMLIEDAAHAPGARCDDRMCGTIGHIGCFSFFANKNLPLGEGGMVVTRDARLAERMRLLRSHGMTTLTWDRHRGHAHTYDVVAPGFNYRLDEIRAALGLVQLERLPAANAARAAIASRYRQLLDGVAGLTVAFEGRHAGSAHHLAVVVLPESTDRGAIQQLMHAQGIQTSVHYPPIHRFAAYRGRYGDRPLPVTDAVAPRLLTLPLYPQLGEGQVEAVASALLRALRTMNSSG